MASPPSTPALPAQARRVTRALLVPLLALGLSACAPRQMVLGELADSLASQGQSAEDDPDLARDAAPFYLKLSESVLREQPGHLPLSAAVAGGFTQYAYAFVAFEADRLEATDARAAARLRARAAALYRRGRDHALRALEAAKPGLRHQLETQGSPSAIDRKMLPSAYWAAAAWGGLISLSKDDPDTVADLPVAIQLARLAWAVDPAYGDGALASLMGSFESARPGGSPQQAQAYFDEALRLGAGRNVGAFVAKAEGLAQPAGDKAAFVALLQQALAVQDTPGSPMVLSNAVMRRRAAWLLETADDLF